MNLSPFSFWGTSEFYQALPAYIQYPGFRAWMLNYPGMDWEPLEQSHPFYFPELDDMCFTLVDLFDDGE